MMRKLTRFAGLGFMLMQLASSSAAPAEDTVAPVNGPRIAVPEKTFNFGEVKYTDTLAHDFIVTNTGNALLEIFAVQPDCGCTVAGAWDRKIEPGGTGKIPIEFKPVTFNGHVTKGVTVTCNDPAFATHRLQFEATVWRPFDVRPVAVTFLSVEGETVSKTVYITNKMMEEVKLEPPVCTNEIFKTELKTVRPGREFELRITWSGQSNANLHGLITMKTSTTNAPTVTVAVNAVPMAALVILPQQIQLPAAMDHDYKQPVIIRNNSRTPVTLSEPSVNAKEVTVRLEETESGKSFALHLGFPTAFQPPNGQPLALTVKTTNPRYPLIRVPIVPAVRAVATKSTGAVTEPK